MMSSYIWGPETQAFIPKYDEIQILPTNISKKKNKDVFLAFWGISVSSQIRNLDFGKQNMLNIKNNGRFLAVWSIKMSNQKQIRNLDFGKKKMSNTKNNGCYIITLGHSNVKSKSNTYTINTELRSKINVLLQNVCSRRNNLACL